MLGKCAYGTGLMAVGMLLASGMAASGNPRFADAWDWPLPPRLFGSLSQDERLQFTRAETLMREGQYDAAAIEFEKFLAQSGRTPVRPHALLLQGYGLHLGRQRNAAIARYTELMDFYAESVDQAVPALFLMGWAHRQNGNTELAVQTWESLTANARYHPHPLTDRALLELATHYAERNEPRKAERHLDKVVELFTEAFVRPSQSALDAHVRLTRLYIQEARYPALDVLLDKPVPYVLRPAELVQRADYVYTQATVVLAALDSRHQSRFFAWFRECQPHYERARRLDDYYDKTTQLALRIRAQDDWRMFITRMLEYAKAQPNRVIANICERITRQLAGAQHTEWSLRAEWRLFIDLVLSRGEALAPSGQIQLYAGVAGAMPRTAFEDGSQEAVFWDTLIARMAAIYVRMLNPERDAGLAGLVDRLMEAERLDQALRMADQMEYEPFAMTKKVAVLIAGEDFANAAEMCEAIEAADTGDYASRALETRAGLYAEKLGRYEEAIVLYQTINDPPRTVWAIIGCHERRGALQDAVAMCDELENFFPDQAGQAAYRKAMIWHNANDRERAIAAFRAVLRRYPKHPVAVQAHQMQERYGFDFGGGVTEEMR